MKTKYLKSGLALAIAFLCCATAYAQSTISGKVVDTNGEPLFNVNVVVKGISKGAVSDFEGNYTILNVEDGTYKIEASSLGYGTVSKDIIVAGQDLTIDFQLKEDASSLDQIIVTGVANPKSRLESSVSITTIKPTVLEQSAPRTTAEIFRTVPGIRAESSGGEGNSNIAVRGVPVSSGGSKYVQIQEDGLPVLLFGDMSFATADIFTRYDSNIARIEAIRGGSASTLSSNSPGAIINLISKTGRTEGGSLSTTFGADYDNFRTDFEYGSPIADGLYFHMGGFYRVGQGVREAGYTANKGGQFKFNITKEFQKGYVRLYAKYLNDKAIAYLPNPIAVSGTNDDPEFSNIRGFDANNETLHTPFLRQNVGLGASGQLRRSDVGDGMNPISTSVGMEASFNLIDDWKLTNNGRFSFNKGGFNSPFPASVLTADDFLAGGFATDRDYASLTYADNGAPVAGDAILAPTVLFDTQLNNFNNFMNDTRLSKSFEKLDVTVGYFKSFQNVSMSWLWNSYLLEASGDRARLINAFTDTGEARSENGLIGYGSTLFGNCCERNYDTEYNVSAPYADISLEATEMLNFNASVRYDSGRVSGSFAGPTQTTYDVNNDGQISFIEQNVGAIDVANPTAVDYEYDYFSYSFGANLKLTDTQAMFARYSRGASAKADRILFAGLDYLDGDNINALDFLAQAELGYKQGFENGAVYATAFYAQTTEEGGFEATTQSIIENDYKSLGLEVEGFYSIDDLSLRGGVTYVNAEIDSGDNAGNKPRRQPDFIYNFLPSYSFGTDAKHNVGLSFIGQTKAFAQDSNELVLPAFLIVSGNVNFAIAQDLRANLSVNNIFDSLGITESEEGSITEGQTNFIRVRPVPGRSISLGLNYSF
ncbi:MAG: TonB-dependent receptor [Nonlabens sp.]